MKRAVLTAFRRLPRPVRLRLIRIVAPSYTLGAVVVMTRPDRTLLLVEQRHAEGWALPGGLVRRGELPEDGLVREIAEEIGITLERESLPVPLAIVTPSAQRVDIVYLCPRATAVDAHPVEGDVEVTGVGWFALDALPEVTEPTLDILRGVRVL